MDLRIVCQKCSTEYKIPEEKFKGRPSRFVCKQCQQEIFLLPGQDGQPQVTGGRIRSPFESETSKQLGKFKDLRRIASGGMGDIYLAKQTGAEGFEREMVLKVLHAHLARDSSFSKVMVDEAKITVLLNHPNIVQMYNLERAGDLLYCVMEYVPGESLAQIQRNYRRKNGRVPLDMAIFVVAEALEGLAYAHEMKDSSGEPMQIVHRDISPHNIMVTREGWVKIIDFGIAKAASRITETQPGTIKGKFAYMAPEQFKGKSDHRADLLAMGVVLWEVLAGVRLFLSNTDVDTLQKVLHLDPPPISMSRPGISKKLDVILTKALSKDPEQRYQSARDFKADLLRFIAPKQLSDLRSAVDVDATHLGEGVPATDDVAYDDETPVAEFDIPVGDPESKKGRGRTGLWAGLAALLLIGLGVGAWLAWPLLAGKEIAPASDAGVQPADPVDAGLVVASLDGGVERVDAGVAVVDAGPLDGGQLLAMADRRRHIRPAKRVKLTKAMIQKRLQRRGARLQRCADQHLIQAGLGSNVDLVLEFTIDMTGKVIRSRLTPAKLEGSSFGRCLSQQVRRIKFPRHLDKTVTVSFPLRFKAVGG